VRSASQTPHNRCSAGADVLVVVEHIVGVVLGLDLGESPVDLIAIRLSHTTGVIVGVEEVDVDALSAVRFEGTEERPRPLRLGRADPPRTPKRSSSGTQATPAGPQPYATAASSSTVPRSSYGTSPPRTLAARLPTSSRSPGPHQAPQADIVDAPHLDRDLVGLTVLSVILTMILNLII
jgi:hypothetical protein